jgi:ribonuclease HI
MGRFEAISGMSQNREKTALIKALNIGIKNKIKKYLPRDWQGLKEAISHVYLGILIGRKVQLEDVYANAMTKIENRVINIIPVLRTLSRTHRVRAFNCFIFSMLTYLLNHLPFPYGVTAGSALVRLENLTRRCVARYNGTAYPYHQLIATKDKVGLLPVVEDAWGKGMANVIVNGKGNLEAYDGKANNIKINLDSESMVIEDIAKANTADFVCRDLDYTDAPFRSKDFIKEDDKGTKKAIYKRLMQVGYRYYHQDPNIADKLKDRGLPCEQKHVDQLHGHFAASHPKLPDYHRNITFDIIFNSLSTEWRYSAIKAPKGGSEEDRQAAKRAMTSTCYFCQEGMDSAEHIYGECVVIIKAREAFGRITGTLLLPQDLGADSFYASSCLAFEKTREGPTNAIFIFNAAVWLQRCNYFTKTEGGHTNNSATKRVTEAALDDWINMWSDKVAKGKFGKAGKRTEAQTIAAREYANDIINKIPKGSTICYTDGASKGNPGVAGAGAVIVHPGSVHGTELSLGTGREGTNNEGELVGIIMALEHIIHNNIRSAKTYILTDSSYAIGVIMLGWVTKSNGELVKLAKRLITSLGEDNNQVIIQWVPGHADVEGNELADNMANQGVKKSIANNYIDIKYIKKSKITGILHQKRDSG